jgi:hypothetical protein
MFKGIKTYTTLARQVSFGSSVPFRDNCLGFIYAAFFLESPLSPVSKEISLFWQEVAVLSHMTVELNRIPEVNFHPCFHNALHPDCICIRLREATQTGFRWALNPLVSTVCSALHWPQDPKQVI